MSDEVSPPDPDLPLVRALAGGDDGALNELIAKYKEPLFRFAYRYVADEQQALDITQETFVRAYFGIGRFRPRAKFVAWLYGIATNLCRDWARGKAHRQAQLTVSLEEAATAAHSPAPTPAREAESHERMATLEAAIFELPHHLRTALILFALEGHSQQECAELLGISAKAVETRVYRARKLLKKMLHELR